MTKCQSKVFVNGNHYRKSENCSLEYKRRFWALTNNIPNAVLALVITQTKQNNKYFQNVQAGKLFLFTIQIFPYTYYIYCFIFLHFQLLLVIAALFAVALAVPAPVAGPNPEPNPQFIYSGYPYAAYPYVYYG